MQARAEKAGVHRMGEIHRGKPKPLRPLKVVEKVVTDPSRDALLTEFGKTTLSDRYLLPGESYQDMFARVATAYADDIGHAQRIYDYISKLWFMPATPVLSNGGAERGLPISCFLECCRRFTRRHHGHLERERVARLQWRRHRHLLGRRSFHRRKGRPERTDQRHHSVHPRDGLADAGDLARLAAPRFGGCLSRYPPPGDRGIPRNPQSQRAISTARA